MLDPALLALSVLVSRQELRFDPVREQIAPGGCGVEVVSALLDGGSRPLMPSGQDALSLAWLASSLREGGIDAYPRRLDPSALDEALDKGWSPLILHYDRPFPHWALLLGRDRQGYELGDPARGLEVLGRGELEERYSGAAILVDPGSLSPGTRERVDDAWLRARRRFSLLAENLDQGQAGREGTAEMGAALEIGEGEEGPPWSVEGRLRLSNAEGVTLEFRLAAKDSSGNPKILPWISAERVFAFERSFASLGASLGAMDGPSLDSSLGLVVDPLLLTLGVKLFGLGEDGIGAALSMGAVEALSDRAALSLSSAVDLRGSAPIFVLSFAVELRLEALALELGWKATGNEGILRVAAAAEKELGRWARPPE